MSRTTPRYSWTQPSCDECWADEFGYGGSGGAVRIVDEYRDVERCVYCNAETRSGIYVRVDPAEAAFPTRVKE